MFSFENLTVYKKAFQTNQKVYHLLKSKQSLAGYLTNQLGRASLSIMFNIAEGSAKFPKQQLTYTLLFRVWLMAEKIFKRIYLFVNLENFTDTRQNRYKNVVNGSHLNPTFDDIWTHTEGFVVNGGIKIKL